MRRLRAVVVVIAIAACASIAAVACSEVPDLHFVAADATDDAGDATSDTLIADGGMDVTSEAAPSMCPGTSPEGGICCGETLCINCNPGDCNDCNNANCKNGRECCRRNNNLTCRVPDNC